MEADIEQRLNDASEKFKAVVTESSNLSAKMEEAASNTVDYRRAMAEAERLMPKVESQVSACRAVVDTGLGLQEELEKVKAVTVGIVAVGKVIDDARKSGEKIVGVLEELDFKDCDRVREIANAVDVMQSRFDTIQEAVVEKQHSLNTAIVQSQDGHHNLLSMLQWVIDGEARLAELKLVSLDRAVLTDQIQEHRVFTSDLDNRRPRVNSVVEQCQAQGMDGQTTDELLDRFDALQRHNEERGQQLEDVINRLTTLHGNVHQMESWLSGAVHSLKRDSNGYDQAALRSKIESLYRQKQMKQADLEHIKAIGRELIDDPLTGEKHRLRETLADMQGKWHDLTELLVQMISYSVRWAN